MIEPFDSEAGLHAAIDATIRAASHELRIFDHDLARLALDEPARSALLLHFLAAGAGRRMHIVLHDPRPLQIRHPRLNNLIRTHGHQLEIRQTPDHLRHLADCFVLADGSHGALRFHADQPRGKRIDGDAVEVLPAWLLFDELWSACQVCTPSTASL